MSDLAVSIGFNRSMSAGKASPFRAFCTLALEDWWGNPSHLYLPYISNAVWLASSPTMTRSLLSGEAVRKLEKQNAVEAEQA